jgi:hypothetical protein
MPRILNNNKSSPNKKQNKKRKVVTTSSPPSPSPGPVEEKGDGNEKPPMEFLLRGAWESSPLRCRFTERGPATLGFPTFYYITFNH